MSDVKIGALLPIRLASERLPAKALLEICGRPILWHLLDRVSASRYLEKQNVVVCTTEMESDDRLVEMVEKYGCSVFRGSTDDIIKRFHDAIEAYGFDAILQVDGDDPLCDTQYMDLTMEKLLGDPSLDIVVGEGLPIGIAAKSFRREAMDKVYSRYKTEKNDTGAMYFFTKTYLCKKASVVPLRPEHRLDEARLTLDYKEDLEVFTKIFEALYSKGEVFDLEEVTGFLRSHPEVMKINAVVEEEYWENDRVKAQLVFEDDYGTLVNV